MIDLFLVVLKFHRSFTEVDLSNGVEEPRRSDCWRYEAIRSENDKEVIR